MHPYEQLHGGPCDGLLVQTGRNFWYAGVKGSGIINGYARMNDGKLHWIGRATKPDFVVTFEG